MDGAKEMKGDRLWLDVVGAEVREMMAVTVCELSSSFVVVLDQK